MRTLTYQYPVCMGLFHRSRQTALPERYDELSGEQFQAVVLLSKGWITEPLFFSRFFNIPLRLLPSIDSYVAYQLNTTLDFLRKLQPVNKMLIPSLPAIINGRKTTLLPPEEKLAGMTFQQFMTVDTFHSWYVYSEKVDYLHSFVAALYTDPSVPFSKMVLDSQVEGILSMERNTRELFEAISVNWMLVKMWLSDSYPQLFPSLTPNSTQSDQKPKKTKPSSWLPVFDALVDDDLTRVETYQTLQAIDVIRIINRKIADQKKKKK